MEFRIFTLVAFSLFITTQALPASRPGGVSSLSPTDPLATKMASFIVQTLKNRRNMRDQPNILQMGPVNQQVVAGLLVNFGNLTLGSGAKIEDCEATVWSQPWSKEAPKLTKLFCVSRPLPSNVQGGPMLAGGLSDTSVSAEGARKALAFAEAEINKRRNSPFFWRLVSVNKAKHQVVSGSMYHFVIEMAPTSCRKELGANLRGGCYPTEAKHEKCVGVKIWSQPWMPVPLQLVDDEMKCSPMSADLDLHPVFHEPENEAECLAKHAGDPCAHAYWIEDSKQCVVAMDMCHCSPGLVVRSIPGKCCNCVPAPVVGGSSGNGLLGSSSGSGNGLLGSGSGNGLLGIGSSGVMGGIGGNNGYVAGSGAGASNSGSFGVSATGGSWGGEGISVSGGTLGHSSGGGSGASASSNGPNPFNAKTEAECMALRRENPCYRPSWMPFPAPGRCAVAVMSCACRPGTKPAPSKDVCCNCIPETTTMTTPFPSNTKCERSRTEADIASSMGMTGQMTPTCEADGSYSSLQCHSSIGYCWCALADGKEVDGTRFSVRSPGYTKPDCSVHRRNGGAKSKCMEAKADADRRSAAGIIGHFTPSCDADGSYSAEQCHGSTGYCWCAMADGKEVDGTKLRGAKRDCRVHRRSVGGTNNNFHNNNGMSNTACASICTMDYRPVCDSNGITHGNKCAFEIAACEAKNMNMNLVMVNEGPCRGTPTPNGAGGVVMDRCIGEGCKCPPGQVGVQPFCRDPGTPTPNGAGGVVTDRCIGEGCKCPPGQVGAQPFCRDPDAAYICSLPSRVGFESGLSCLAAFQKFFFNQNTGKCEQFLYGGCGDPIANRFDSKALCEQTCANAVPTVSAPSRETCLEGTTKMIQCNTCHCTNGIWACTLMLCTNEFDPMVTPPPMDKCIGDSCICPPGMVGVQPFCRPGTPTPNGASGVIMDRCVGEGCKCPPGQVGVEPFCHDPVVECNKICTMEYMPVCDNNGRTHSSECTFETAACEAKKDNINLFIAKKGPCDASSTPNVECPKMCTMEYMPVCDSNGVTHGNKCAFFVAACEARKKGQNIAIVKDGPCQDTPACQEGESKKIDCNDCRCMKGLWACTKRFCFPTTPAPTPDKCEGASCECPPGMRGIQPFCRPGIPKPAILATGICARSPQLPCCNATISIHKMLNGPFEIADLSYPDCRPDGYYAAKQCHWAGCYCVDANGKSVEGENQPLDIGNRDIKCPGQSECTNGETKKKDCNTCTCSNGVWACTEMFCLNPISAGANTNGECMNGATKKEDCNTCTCSNGRWACTLKLCLNPSNGGAVAANGANINGECMNGATKKEDCNTCVCSNGRWGCTMMACLGGTGTRNSFSGSVGSIGTGSGTATMNSMTSSGEACLSSCNSAHNPWKEIGETPGKEAAWNCVDKCREVTCNRKCEVVFPNRGEELTVMSCKTQRCKSEKTTDRPTDLNKKYGVKGGLRSFVTKKPSGNYGVKS